MSPNRKNRKYMFLGYLNFPIIFINLISVGGTILFLIQNQKIRLEDFIIKSISLGSAFWIIFGYLTILLIPKNSIQYISLVQSIFLLCFLYIYIKKKPLYLDKHTIYITTIESLWLTIILLYFYKYPYFHSFSLTQDVFIHTRIMYEIINRVNIEKAIWSGYPKGLHILTYFLVSYITNNPLDIRYVAGFYEMLFPLAIYVLGLNILKNEKFSLILSSILIVFGKGLEYLYGMGTLPNLVCDFLTISFIIAIFSSKESNVKNVIVIFLLSAMLILLHSTGIVTLVYTFVFFTGLYLIKKEKIYLTIIVPVLIALIGVYIINSNLIIHAKNAPSGKISYHEPQNKIFQLAKNIVPLIAYQYDVYGQILFIAYIISVIYLVYHIFFYKSNKLFYLYMLGFLLFVSMLSFFTGKNTLRLVFYSNTSTIIVVALLIYKMTDFLWLKLKIFGKYSRKIYVSIIIVFVYFLATFSPLLRTYIILFSQNVLLVRETQTSVYEAIEWISIHLDKNDTLVSCVEPYFKYAPYLANITYIGDYYFNASQIDTIKPKPKYIAVWKLAKPYTTFQKAKNIEKIYENKQITIYKNKKSF